MRARLRLWVRRRGWHRGQSREEQVEVGKCVWLGIWVRWVGRLGMWALEERWERER